jgi:hypothetical protein
MSFVQFIIPLEVAHDTIAELGQLGNVQFKDVSQLMQLTWQKSEPYNYS